MRTKQQACDAKKQGYKAPKPDQKKDGFFRKQPAPASSGGRE